MSGDGRGPRCTRTFPVSHNDFVLALDHCRGRKICSTGVVCRISVVLSLGSDKLALNKALMRAGVKGSRDARSFDAVRHSLGDTSVVADMIIAMEGLWRLPQLERAVSSMSTHRNLASNSSYPVFPGRSQAYHLTTA